MIGNTSKRHMRLAQLLKKNTLSLMLLLLSLLAVEAKSTESLDKFSISLPHLSQYSFDPYECAVSASVSSNNMAIEDQKVIFYFVPGRNSYVAEISFNKSAEAEREVSLKFNFQKLEGSFCAPNDSQNGVSFEFYSSDGLEIDEPLLVAVTSGLGPSTSDNDNLLKELLGSEKQQSVTAQTEALRKELKDALAAKKIYEKKFKAMQSNALEAKDRYEVLKKDLLDEKALNANLRENLTNLSFSFAAALQGEKKLKANQEGSESAGELMIIEELTNELVSLYSEASASAVKSSELTLQVSKLSEQLGSLKIQLTSALTRNAELKQELQRSQLSLTEAKQKLIKANQNSELSPELDDQSLSLEHERRIQLERARKPIARVVTSSSQNKRENETSILNELDDVLSETLEEGASSVAPLTKQEIKKFVRAIKQCWVVDVGSPAAGVTVVLGMQMTPDGKVKPGSLRLISSMGGTEAAAKIAFQAARRAILRCQKGGYNLPKEKFEYWQEFEMAFNPRQSSGLELED
jgi:hypothetical protein